MNYYLAVIVIVVVGVLIAWCVGGVCFEYCVLCRALTSVFSFLIQLAVVLLFLVTELVKLMLLPLLLPLILTSDTV